MVVCLLFNFLLENIAFIWKHHLYLWFKGCWIKAYNQFLWSLSREKSPLCHTCCDTGPRVLWPHLKDNPILFPCSFYNKQEVLRMYSNLDSHGAWLFQLVYVQSNNNTDIEYWVSIIYMQYRMSWCFRMRVGIGETYMLIYCFCACCLVVTCQIFPFFIKRIHY